MIRKSGMVVLIMFLLGIVVGLPKVHAEPDAENIATQAYEAAYYPGEDVRWMATMTITDRRDRTRSRKLSILRKNLDQRHRQKYYAYFHEPADLRRMVFLVWTRGAESDDRWLYLPSIGLEQRISGRQKRNAFAGSDFTYEDMTGRHPSQDHLEYIGTDQVEDRSVWVLEGRPKHPDRVEFSRYRTYIDTETYLPLKADFYDVRDQLQRTLTLEEWKTIDGYPTPVRQKAVDHQSGSTTIAEMSDIEYNLGIPESSFDRRYLRRPPTPWIQP